MYKIIDESGNLYCQYKYEKEAEFERMVVSNAEAIFGASGIYFDMKRLIGTPKKGAAVPDGYYLDLTFHDNPRLYLVEVELTGHDVYGHIGEQILRFGISSETDKYKMKSLLLDNIDRDFSKKEKLCQFFRESRYGNINELLDKVIFDSKPAAIIVIDEATEELSNVMGQLTMATEVIEAQTYICGNERLHRFTPFKDDVLTGLPAAEDADELDTIVVPARKEGFEEEFLKNNRWFAVRISGAMLDRIRYIAAYQVAPVSGITYIAEVDRIEKYKDTNKYIVLFRPGSLKKINKVGLGRKKGQAPQAPRYSSYDRILKAGSLDDIWDKSL
ncbi:hypothetical protein [Qiania dongpingensis]|uniref:Uncharacterized protein n=1 Tax=Qiania dongpingensis TaxID=2763669 RepID=A0A7G9G3G7_9FIRM|nr:hypothetical protein [Qiania dongpingensis]QNM05349.1 hypothetical protein H9Q78_13065 [Qiania dongpingensis]